jgi:hypothetical protein
MQYYLISGKMTDKYYNIFHVLDISLHQMAAQGELTHLQQEINDGMFSLLRGSLT